MLAPNLVAGGTVHRSSLKKAWGGVDMARVERVPCLWIDGVKGLRGACDSLLL